MADNPSIDPGTTPSLPVEGDDVGAGVIRQGVVVSWGAKDASVRVTAAAPMPVVQTGTPALPTGAAADATLTANGVLVGPVAETAPATDTASSGLNGRLQRIAQRLSTIIGVLPTALGANGGLKIEGVASGTVVPISGTVTSTPSGTQTVSGTVGVSGNVATTSAAASQADGHSAAIGATTDAAATTTGSVIAQLRRIANAVAGTLSVSGTVTTSPPSNASTNLAQVAGATVAQGHGTAATALRVELPTDGTGVVGIAAGAAVIGALTANQSVNNAQINGVAPLMGNGVSGTGAQRVTIASDSTGVIGVTSAAASQADGHSATIGALADLSSANTLVGLLKAIKAALTGALSVSLPLGSATLGQGRQTVSTAGTPVALAGSQACKQVLVTALSTNTGVIAAGATGVIAAAGTRTGVPLSAGDTAVLDVSNLSLLFIDATVNGEGVSYFWEG